MDIASIKPTTQTVEILHPGDKQPIGVRVVIVSLQDEKMKAVRRGQENKALHRDARKKVQKAEEIHDDINYTIFKSIESWEWYQAEGRESPAQWDGNESPKLNLTTVKDIFEKAEWFKDQISDPLAEIDGFYKP